MTDLISDMFSRINNALQRKKETVEVMHGQLAIDVARILAEQGFVLKHEVLTRGRKKFIRIGLKYVPDKFGKPLRGVITGLRRVSRPGSRMYYGFREIPRIRSGFGCVILTTPKGVMADVEARKMKIGGEVIGFVW